MSRGFGSTFGAGTTDVVLPRYSAAFLIQTSISCWIKVNGIGGGTFGRIFNQFVGGGSGTQLPAMEMNNSLTQMANGIPWSGSSAGQAQWSWNIPSGGNWVHVLHTYDGSSTSNKPVVYVNGSSVTTTTVVTAVGTFNPSPGPWYIGNRQDGLRNFDGLLAEFAVWNGTILSAGEAAALASGVPPLVIQPQYLGTYLPLDGVNNPEFDYTNGPTLSITGTRLGKSDPPVASMRSIRTRLSEDIVSSQLVITSTVAVTEASDALVASVLETLKATIATTEATDVLAALAKETFSSSVAVTESKDVLAALAKETFVSTVAATENPDVLAALAWTGFISTVATTESTDTLAALAKETMVATAPIVERPDTMAALAKLSYSSTVATTESSDTLSALATLVFASTALLIESPDVLSAASSVDMVSTALLIESSDVLSANAILIPAATVSLFEGSDTLRAMAHAPERFKKTCQPIESTHFCGKVRITQ